MKYKVPFIKPHFPSPQDVTQDFKEICDNNWFTNFGPFENKFCRAIEKTYPQNSAYVTTVANATLGLQAAVDILMKNDTSKTEVLIPSFTFAAGPEVLLHAGLKPVFIDIDHSSWQPSLAQAEKYVSDNPKSVAGVLLCNIFGVGNREVAKWEALADKYSIPLVIDSAAGFGSQYDKNEQIGLRGDCEVFSLHATKPFSVGEGGLIVSKNKKLIERMRSYQNFGFDSHRNVGLIGTNAKLQELNCAIGLRQLPGFDERLVGRQQSLSIYKEGLSGLGFEFMENDQFSTVCFASVLAPSADISDKVLTSLNASGVEARRYYSPLHFQQELIEKSAVADTLATTELIYSRIISLPMHDKMATDDQGYIIEVIMKCLQHEEAS